MYCCLTFHLCTCNNTVEEKGLILYLYPAIVTAMPTVNIQYCVDGCHKGNWLPYYPQGLHSELLC